MALESEAASEEEMKVKDCWRLFRPCRWINCSFTRIRVLAEGAVGVAAAASEAENGCAPGGAVVDSNGLTLHFHISIIRRSGGGDAVI